MTKAQTSDHRRPLGSSRIGATTDPQEAAQNLIASVRKSCDLRRGKAVKLINFIIKLQGEKAISKAAVPVKGNMRGKAAIFIQVVGGEDDAPHYGCSMCGEKLGLYGVPVGEHVQRIRLQPSDVPVALRTRVVVLLRCATCALPAAQRTALASNKGESA